MSISKYHNSGKKYTLCSALNDSFCHKFSVVGRIKHLSFTPGFSFWICRLQHSLYMMETEKEENFPVHFFYVVILKQLPTFARKSDYFLWIYSLSIVI